MATVNLVSFGYGHASAPEAHLTLDLRHMTANDKSVQTAALASPGITDLIHAAAAAIAAFANGPTVGTVTIAVGCTGGRHRSPYFARTLLQRLVFEGHNVSIRHRDIDKPVINH
ncbi:RapZ C-terminal domain-containing protein [Streptomyces rochei]|uniref:RapZ C-terminal domain-containing protein n=1 Tax=Streptomyces rochei TaxID=1928 RepID=UPI00406378E7